MSVENLHLANSSNLAWARYDTDRLTLEVDFKNSEGKFASTYEYANFLPSDWDAFKAASSDGKSAGEYFARAIRNAKVGDKPKFPFKRIK